MNTIETTPSTRTTPRREARTPQQLANERDVRDKVATRTKAEEDDLYNNVPCTD